MTKKCFSSKQVGLDGLQKRLLLGMSHFKGMNSSAIEVVSIQPVKYIKCAIPEMENIIIYHWKRFLRI